MSWVNVAGAAVGVVGGIIASKNKDDGGGSAAAGQSAAYYNALANISQQEYDIWKTEGLPILRGLAGQANLDPEAEAAKAATETRTQAALGRERGRRALEFTRNPGDPGYADIMADSYGAEAQEVSRAMTAARDRTRDVNFGRGTTVANMYRGLPGEAMAGYANAGAGLGRTSALYSGIGRDNDARSAQGWYGAVGLGDMTRRWFGGMNRPGTSSDRPEGMGYNNDDFSNMQVGNYGDSGSFGDFAEGGKIKGPGTGTSDSVSALKKPGTYILSEDTVRAMGTKKLRDLAEKAGVRPGDGAEDDKGGVPVRLSNGEWAMPPEVTKYYGEEFFNNLQKKFHRPVQDEGGGRANGGAIRMRALPRNVEDAIFRSVPKRAIRR